MSTHPNKLSGFWQELKRRRVIHVITVYASAAFVLIELVNNLTEPLNLPSGLATIVIIVLAVGFPLAIVLSWLYDLTGEGLERTRPMGEVPEEKTAKVPGAWKIATYVSFVVIIGLVTFNIIGGPSELRAGDIQSLAILPFDNFTGDDQLDFFVSGMHASLIGDMGKVGGLRVIGKTSSNVYKGTDKSAPEIAGELGVDALLEPTVMCLGDTICLQLRLISPFPEEKQLWVAEYKEEKSKILMLYNRMTRQIAEEVRIQLTPEEVRLLAKVITVDAEAYEAYLMGRYYWDDLSPESLYKAMDYLNQAVVNDPGWAAPYAGLAQVWVGLAQMGLESPEVAGPKIIENILKALELDPDFADSHFISGIIAVWTEWNWEKGEKEFLHALSINPNDAMSRIYYAHLLTILQRTDEAVSQGQRAVELDPLNPLIQALYGVVLSSAGDWKGALEVTETALALDPDNFFAYSVMEVVAFHFGMNDRALEGAKVYLRLDENIMKKIQEISDEKGLVAAYEEIVHQMELQAETGFILPSDMAMRYNFVNQRDKAMDWLEMAYEIHDPNMPYITTGFSKCEALYDDPRFIDILRKTNLSIKEK